MGPHPNMENIFTGTRPLRQGVRERPVPGFLLGHWRRTADPLGRIRKPEPRLLQTDRLTPVTQLSRRTGNSGDRPLGPRPWLFARDRTRVQRGNPWAVHVLAPRGADSLIPPCPPQRECLSF